MPTFIAQVNDSRGKAKKEKIVADNAGAASRALREKGLDVKNISLAPGFDITKFFDPASMAKVTVKDKAVFSRQFAAMVNAGVAIVRCLGVLSEQCPNPKLKKALLAISAAVQEGTNISEAMRKHP